jgi:hypothetical protein
MTLNLWGETDDDAERAKVQGVIAATHTGDDESAWVYHTSMSCGDVAVDLESGNIYAVAPVGWVLIGKRRCGVTVNAATPWRVNANGERREAS